MTQLEITFIEDFLNIKDSGKEIRSCLTMALRSARKHTGRDINTGKDILGLLTEENVVNDIYYAEYFTGLTVYLILLDQIGCIFKKVGYKEGQKTNGIQIALENFSTLNPDQIKALRALRNSLTHNFGLTSAEDSRKKAKNKKKEQLYKFCLYYDKNQLPVIPNMTWDGDYNDKTDNTDTIILINSLKVIQFC